MTQGDHVPICFGNGDEKDVLCAGGNDVAYINPEDGSHRRGRCNWFSQCVAKAAAQPSSFIPTANLHKRHGAQMPQHPPGAPHPSVQHAFHPAGVPPMSQRVAPPHPQHQPVQNYNPYRPQMVPQQHAPPQQQQQQQLMVPPPTVLSPQPMAYYQWPGAQMPGYLTVPEPYTPEQHWMGRLVRTITRSMLKAGGHSIANFFDHNPFQQGPK